MHNALKIGKMLSAVKREEPIESCCQTNHIPYLLFNILNRLQHLCCGNVGWKKNMNEWDVQVRHKLAGCERSFKYTKLYFLWLSRYSWHKNSFIFQIVGFCVYLFLADWKKEEFKAGEYRVVGPCFPWGSLGGRWVQVSWIYTGPEKPSPNGNPLSQASWNSS